MRINLLFYFFVLLQYNAFCSQLNMELPPIPDLDLLDIKMEMEEEASTNLPRLPDVITDAKISSETRDPVIMNRPLVLIDGHGVLCDRTLNNELEVVTTVASGAYHVSSIETNKLLYDLCHTYNMYDLRQLVEIIRSHMILSSSFDPDVRYTKQDILFSFEPRTDLEKSKQFGVWNLSEQRLPEFERRSVLSLLKNDVYLSDIVSFYHKQGIYPRFVISSCRGFDVEKSEADILLSQLAETIPDL